MVTKEQLEEFRSNINSAYSNEFTEDQLKYLHKMKQGSPVKTKRFKNKNPTDSLTDRSFNKLDQGINSIDSGISHLGAGLNATRNMAEGLVGSSDYQYAKGAFEADIKRNKGQFTLKAGAENGYGFGLKGAMSSSRSANLASMAFHGPGVAAEGLLNSLGLMTRQQRLAFKSGGVMSKLGTATIPLIGAGILVSSMVNGENPSDVGSMALTSAGLLTGLHTGMRLGGALTPANTAMRGAGLFTGGLIGAATGLAITGGAAYVARDMTSSQSSIANFARKRSKREELTSTFQNNATLTMRQKALQQISSAEMNGRGQVLGNEANMLKFGV